MIPAATFEEAIERAKDIKAKPSNDVLLKLYAYYKQTKEGDTHGDKPSAFDFKGRAKYEAWEALRGMSKEEASSKYIALVNNLIDTK